MRTSLTEQCQFVKQFDELAGEIYEDKQYYFLTLKEIAKLRGVSIELARDKYLKAKQLIRDPEHAWMHGLSSKSKTFLLNRRYKGFSELYSDIMSEKFDLSAIPGVGQKLAWEIRRWCLKQNHS